jgi:hypothetical protein
LLEGLDPKSGGPWKLMVNKTAALHNPFMSAWPLRDFGGSEMASWLEETFPTGPKDDFLSRREIR